MASISEIKLKVNSSLLGGFLLALIYFAAGLLMCITIIGIPFAKAHWRLMKMSFMPFGLTTK